MLGESSAKSNKTGSGTHKYKQYDEKIEITGQWALHHRRKEELRDLIQVFRLEALAWSVIATATWLAGCPSQPVLYQND